MTKKTRNRLIIVLILIFPIVVLVGFVLSEYLNPPK
jgi:cytochrome c-type biogenesis protein CcmE